MLENEEVQESTAPETHSEEYLDSLADGVDKPRNSERAMTAAPKEAAPSKEEMFEFVHNGKTIKANKEQLIKYAQQGYDYPQRAQKLNQQTAKWNQERADWEKKWGIYKQIDDYARQNQDWWNFINQQWQSRGSFNPQSANAPANTGTGTQGDPVAAHPKLAALEQRLQQFEPLINQLAEDRRLAHEKAEDEKLEQEIQSIRNEYKDLDWDSLNEEGKTLEHRVLEHAQATGINSFRAAARDLLFDQLVTRANSQGKLAVAKGIQQRTKLGVLGESPTSVRTMPKSSKDIRKTSYEELEAEVREDIRAGRFA